MSGNSFYILFLKIGHYAGVLLRGALIIAPFARTAPLPLPPGHTAEHLQIVLAGGLMGATHAVAVIESSHWWLGVFAAVVLGAGAVCTACRSGIDMHDNVHVSPYVFRAFIRTANPPKPAIY
jgi:hypothetical protein